MYLFCKRPSAMPETERDTNVSDKELNRIEQCAHTKRTLTEWLHAQNLIQYLRR
jgi:hypothetical protein